MIGHKRKAIIQYRAQWNIKGNPTCTIWCWRGGWINNSPCIQHNNNQNIQKHMNTVPKNYRIYHKTLSTCIHTRNKMKWCIPKPLLPRNLNKLTEAISVTMYVKTLQDRTNTQGDFCEYRLRCASTFRNSLLGKAPFSQKRGSRTQFETWQILVYKKSKLNDTCH
jgi:hypothetical protein